MEHKKTMPVEDTATTRMTKKVETLKMLNRLRNTVMRHNLSSKMREAVRDEHLAAKQDIMDDVKADPYLAHVLLDQIA